MADPKLIRHSLLSSRLASRSQRETAPKSRQPLHRQNILAFTSRPNNRVILKLAQARIAALLQRDDIVLLTTGKWTTKE
jgi:hypothetical protein